MDGHAKPATHDVQAVALSRAYVPAVSMSATDVSACRGARTFDAAQHLQGYPWGGQESEVHSWEYTKARSPMYPLTPLRTWFRCSQRRHLASDAAQVGEVAGERAVQGNQGQEKGRGGAEAPVAAAPAPAAPDAAAAGALAVPAKATAAAGSEAAAADDSSAAASNPLLLGVGAEGPTAPSCSPLLCDSARGNGQDTQHKGPTAHRTQGSPLRWQGPPASQCSGT